MIQEDNCWSLALIAIKLREGVVLLGFAIESL